MIFKEIRPVSMYERTESKAIFKTEEDMEAQTMQQGQKKKKI